jgi:hypothetical protein
VVCGELAALVDWVEVSVWVTAGLAGGVASVEGLAEKSAVAISRFF